MLCMRRCHQAGQGDRPRRVRQVGPQALCRRVGRRPAVGIDVRARREARAAPVFAARCREPPHAVPPRTSCPAAIGAFPLPARLLTPLPPPPRAPAPAACTGLWTAPAPAACTGLWTAPAPAPFDARARVALGSRRMAPPSPLRPYISHSRTLPAMPPARRRKAAVGGGPLDIRAPSPHCPDPAPALRRGAAPCAAHPP